MKKIISKYISKEKLLVSKNSTSYFFEIIIYFAVIVFWIVTILNQYNSKDYKDHSIVLICLFLLIPLLMLPNLLRSIRVFINGEDYIFDSHRKEITRNKKRIAFFDNIEFIQIRTFYDSDNENIYRLSLS